MKIQEILKLEDYGKIFDKLCVDNVEDRDIDKNLENYEGKHDILNRLNESIGSAPEEKPDGTLTPDTRKTIITTKLVLNLQQKIVKMAVAFLFGSDVKIKLNNPEEPLKKAYQNMLLTYKNVKINSFNRKLAKACKSESKAAELWYITKDKDIRIILLCKKNGDDFYPHYDEHGDVDAITRRYASENEKGVLIEHNDIHMAKKVIYTTKRQSGNSYEITEKENSVGKIMIIFSDQKKPDSADVQTLIARLEMIISKLADSNDRNAFPILKATGLIDTFPDKDSVGKVFTIKGEDTAAGGISYGDVNYLVAPDAAESLTLEIDNLLRFVCWLTGTANISFDNIKGINSNLSGNSIKLMFLDPISKAKDDQEIFGEHLDRRNNLMKAILLSLDVNERDNYKKLNLTNEFGSILPESDMEKIQMLAESRPGENLIDKPTAVKNHPFVENADDVIAEMEKEEKLIGGQNS